MRKLVLLTGLMFGVADLGVAQSITYDYTGTVTETDGIFASVAVGATVTGTYTFDLANANPSESTGVTGSTTQFWNAVNHSQDTWNAPRPALVFSSTAEVDGIFYVTHPSVSYESSNVSGDPAGGFGGPTFIGEEIGSRSASVYQASELTLEGNSQPWSSAGLPLLNRANVMALGTFEDIIGPQENVVGFNVTSLTVATRAPETNASGMAGALTLLLGAIAVVPNQRRT
jgi:hypothetical protein